MLFLSFFPFSEFAALDFRFDRKYKTLRIFQPEVQKILQNDKITIDDVNPHSL